MFIPAGKSKLSIFPSPFVSFAASSTAPVAPPATWKIIGSIASPSHTVWFSNPVELSPISEFTVSGTITSTADFGTHPIGDEQSALTDSFQDNLLSPPVYTRPAEYKGLKVPEVLLSGNFPKIDAWRSDKAYERTQQIRPDLLNEPS